MITNGKGFLAALLCSVCPTAVGVPVVDETSESLVVVSTGDTDARRRQTGIVLGAEHVLTLKPRRSSTDEWVVEPWTSSARLVGAPIPLEGDLPIAVLEVPGLEAASVTFALQDAAPGQVVYSPTRRNEKATLSKGAVGDMTEFQPMSGFFTKKEKGPLLELVSHNAMIDAEGFGAPVLNECGDVLGISLGDPRLDNGERYKDPRDIVVSLNGPQIVEWLQSRDLEIETTDRACMPAEERAALAREQAAAAKAKKAEAEKEAEQAKEKVGEAEKALQDAEERLKEIQSAATATEADKERAKRAAKEAKHAYEEAQKKLKDANENLENAQEDLAEARAQVGELKARLAELEAARVETRRKTVLYGGISAAVVVLLLLIWLSSFRKKKRQIQAAENRVQYAEKQVAEHQSRIAPFDCVLEGEDGEGKRHLLKLHRSVLGETSGVVIGRNPRDATYVVENEGVSREHIRLYVKEDALYVEDLGSANGTRIHGIDVSPGQPATLKDGDTVDIGPVTFSVSLNY